MTRSSDEIGGSTPEELETLLEDALVLRDSAMVIGCFEEQVTLVIPGVSAVHGADACCALVLDAWQGDQTYVADPRSITQTRELALVVSDSCVSVMRRQPAGGWRYAIMLRYPAVDKECGPS